MRSKMNLNRFFFSKIREKKIPDLERIKKNGNIKCILSSKTEPVIIKNRVANKSSSLHKKDDRHSIVSTVERPNFELTR